FHGARDRGYPAAEKRSEESSRPALRHSRERHRTWWRLDPYSPARRAKNHLRRNSPDPAGHGEGAFRLHAGGLPLRRTTAWRHRPWVRPHERHSLWHPQHSRRDRLPEDGESDRPHDRIARAGGSQTTPRPAHPAPSSPKRSVNEVRSGILKRRK